MNDKEPDAEYTDEQKAAAEALMPKFIGYVEAARAERGQTTEKDDIK